MTDKIVANVGVEVDELGLSLLGWDIECRARLVTKESDRNGHAHQVAVSVTARFLPEDWNDRFTRFGREGDDAEVPQLFVTLNQRASELVPGCLELVNSFTTVENVGEFALRLSEVSKEWIAEKPLHADEISVTISAADLTNIRNVYSNSPLEFPPTKPRKISVEIIDETRVRSVTAHVTAANADIGSRPYSNPVIRVHLEGLFEIVPEQLSGFPSTRSGGIAVPRLELEVLDEEGFLLDTDSMDFHCIVPVDAAKVSPRRQPRWVVHWEHQTDDYAGEPSRVIIRLRGERP
ncbi:hypothetical protein [Nocardia vaccinii]|uniref:hypothetical protein n=1 Tax=Nocardia vaccinii TaxID=1822 RepID=UPI0012F4A107|nr:hypothetical protein [Nocardia vaccinii]